MRRLHFTQDYRKELTELLDVYNDERPRMPYLLWMVCILHGHACRLRCLLFLFPPGLPQRLALHSCLQSALCPHHVLQQHPPCNRAATTLMTAFLGRIACYLAQH